MKFKVKRKKRTGECVIRAEGSKTETIDFADAQAIASRGRAVFLPLTCSENGTVPSIQYYANGLIPLSEFLTDEYSAYSYQAVLCSYLNMMCCCDKLGLKLSRVLYDFEMTFFDMDSQRLSFVYVPINSFSPQGISMRDAILTICENALYLYPAVLESMNILINQIMRTPILSSIDFERMLKEAGILASSDANEGAGNRQDTTSAGSLSSKSSHGFDFVRAQKQEPAKKQSGMTNGGSLLAALINVDTGEQWRLHEGENSIGRLGACDIVLSGERDVSRTHAVVEHSDAGLFIRDCNSKNGVQVNGVRINPRDAVALHHGDAIRIGSKELLVSIK